MVSGGDGGDERGQVSSDSVDTPFEWPLSARAELAHDVSSHLEDKLKKAIPEAQEAWKHLIWTAKDRGNDEYVVKWAIRRVMRNDWSIAARMEKEHLAKISAPKAAADLASLITWVNELDLLSLFPEVRPEDADPTDEVTLLRTRKDMKADFAETLARIQRVAARRTIVAHNAPAIFGYTDERHTSPEARHAAALRYTLGHLARVIQELTHADNFDIVSMLAEALFDIYEFDEKNLKKYRATAAKCRQAIKDLGLSPDLLWEV
jgi:hypothetical protein